MKNIKITADSILVFYCIVPSLLGMLLGDVFGYDLSIQMKEYFGIFYYLELAGIDTKVKSMMILMIFVFSPLLLLYIKKINVLSYENVLDRASIKTLSNTKVFLLMIIGGLILGGMMLYIFFIHGVSINNIQGASRREALIIIIMKYNFVFGPFYSLMMLSCVSFFSGVMFGFKILQFRFKKN